MGQPFAPDIDKSHQKDFCEEIEIENASQYGASSCQENNEPEEIIVPLTAEDLGLNFADCDEGEIGVEDETEVELPHEDQRSEGTPEVKLHDASPKGVGQQLGCDDLQSYEKGGYGANCEIGSGEKGSRHVPTLELL